MSHWIKKFFLLLPWSSSASSLLLKSTSRSRDIQKMTPIMTESRKSPPPTATPGGYCSVNNIPTFCLDLPKRLVNDSACLTLKAGTENYSICNFWNCFYIVIALPVLLKSIVTSSLSWHCLQTDGGQWKFKLSSSTAPCRCQNKQRTVSILKITTEKHFQRGILFHVINRRGNK